MGKEFKVGQVLAKATAEEIAEIEEITRQRTAARNVTEDMVKALSDRECELLKLNEGWWKRIKMKYNLPNEDELKSSFVSMSCSHQTKEIHIVSRSKY